MSAPLSEKEQKVIQYIRDNPYISQQELANLLAVSRPTVANMISALMKKGYIVGRAYILTDDEPVICIGGANVDRKFYTLDKAELGTSNPSKSSQSVGGVARNVAENLGRLGLPVNLITGCGEDTDWSYIEEVSAPFMNLELITKVEGQATGSYTAVLDSTGELIIALADMEIYDYLTPELIQKQEPHLLRARAIVVDLNIPKETIQFLTTFAKRQQIPLIVIGVSAPKMSRLPNDLSGVTWFIGNRDESEAFFQTKWETEEDWKESVKKWLSLGVENVAVTNGKEGAMIGNKEALIHVPAIQNKQIVDVTGAGDAFSSALIYSWLEGKHIDEIGKAASVNAFKTLQSPFTVRQELSKEQLEKDMEEF